MATAIYPALVQGDGAGGFTARLVDFEDAVIGAGTLAALMKAARERLHALLGALDRQGRDWPAPTGLETLHASGEGGGAPAAAVVLVEVQVEEAPIRVNISIGERLLRRLDAAAEAQNMTRSGFIASAVRQRLGEAEPGVEKGAGGGTGGARLREEVVELRRRVNEAVGPESAFGRFLSDLDSRALEGLRSFTGGASRERGPRPGE